jgi:hypothetical protein
MGTSSRSLRNLTSPDGESASRSLSAEERAHPALRLTITAQALAALLELRERVERRWRAPSASANSAELKTDESP